MAALHYNENGKREQAVTQAGDDQWKYRSPKARKGHHSVDRRLKPATYGNMTIILLYGALDCIPVLLPVMGKTPEVRFQTV